MSIEGDMICLEKESSEGFCESRLEVYELYRMLCIKILKDRARAIERIKKAIRAHIQRKSVVQVLLVKKLMESRLLAIKMIKDNIKEYILKKLVKQVKAQEKLHRLKIIYEKPCLSAKVKIVNSFKMERESSQTLINLDFCKLRNYYVCYLPLKSLSMHKITFNFIIDGSEIISPDYPGEFFNNSYYNYIQPKKIKEAEEQRQKDFKTVKNLLRKSTFEKVKNFKSIALSCLTKEEIAANLGSGLATARHSLQSSKIQLDKGQTTSTSISSSSKKLKHSSHSMSELSNFQPKSILKKIDSKSDLSKRVVITNKVEFLF